MKNSALITTLRTIVRIGGTVLQVAVLIWVVSFIARSARTAYDFGYRVFTEPPMQEAPGSPVAIAITEDNKRLKNVAKYLKDRGLVREPYLFMVQEILSPYHNKIQPGFYELNTSMTSDEMLAIMVASYEEEEAPDLAPAPEFDYDAGYNDDTSTESDVESDALGTDDVPSVPDIPYEEGE